MKRCRFLYLLLLILPLGGCVSTPSGVLNPEWVKQQEDREQKLKELRDAAAPKMAQLRDAVKRGDAEAQYQLGCEYLRSVDVEGHGSWTIYPDSEAEGLKWFRKAAEQGHAEAQYQLWWKLCGCRWIDSESDAATLKKREEGIKWLYKAAEQGHARAQCDLGSFYLHGTTGMPVDPTEAEKAEAVKWFRKAVEQGVGMIDLGMCYRNGDGVPEDKAEALRWFRKAADNGTPNAMYLVGWCYFEGLGVPQDKEEAVRWYRKAAELGDWAAMFSLGKCYYDGEGVPQDTAEAIKWYLKAEENGDTLFAGKELIRCYIRGEYDPGEETVNNWLCGLRRWTEHIDELKGTKNVSEYTQKEAEEYAELLREMERIRKPEPQS